MRDDDVADRRGCSSYVDSADGGDASAVILDATILNREPVQNGSPRLAIREVGCGCASFAAVKDGVGGAAGRAGCAGYQNGLAVEVDVLVIGAWIDEDGVACVCGVDGFLDLLYGWPGPTLIVVCAKAASGSKGIMQTSRERSFESMTGALGRESAASIAGAVAGWLDQVLG
jgi:hypothetical protein